MKKHKLIILALAVFFLAVGTSFPSLAAGDDYVCAVYFTGVGCPHCANVDPFALGKWLKEYPSLVIAEYEVYQERGNADLIYEYNSKYGSGLGIPLLIFNENEHFVGDNPILQNARQAIENFGKNEYPLINGTSISFNDLDIASLPGRVKIWRGERILISNGSPADNEALKGLIAAEAKDLGSALGNVEYKAMEPKPVALSGSNVNFENAIELEGGWIFQWNGPNELVTGNREPATGNRKPATGNQQPETIKEQRENKGDASSQGSEEPEGKEAFKGNEESGLTLAKILSLAAVDAINPCALAVLVLMLVAILTYDPKNRKNVILAGLAFTASIFAMYLFYGLVIVRFFQVVQSLAFVRLWLYKILGGAAIALGILNVRDFARYRPGRMGTEMPMFMRPRVKRIISGITSPRGAFMVGIFVTVFLLPCTIGPYVICGGILCALDFIETLPWLLAYNLVFVLPMIFVVFLVYFGVAKVEDVSGWKEKNIRRLHLISGIIILALGLAMLLGWV